MKDIVTRLLNSFYKGSKLQPPPPTEKRVGNMNDDDPEDHRSLNTTVDEYFMVEVVAVPPNFEITNHLKMREAAGIFDHEKVNLRQLITISMAVKATPIFSALNNPLLDPYSCMYFLHIMAQLGLIIKSADNPIKRNREEYEVFLKRWEEGRHIYVRGQDVLRMNFIVINLVPLYQQNVMDEAVDAVNSVLDHTENVKRIKESL